MIFFLPVHAFCADVDIFSFASSIKAKVLWDQRNETGELMTDRYIYTFKPGIPWVVTDSSKKIGSSSVYMKNGMLMVPEALADEIRKYDKASAVVEVSSGHRVAAIFIDPGHGGKDPGAVGTHKRNGKTQKVYEKSVVLDISTRLQKMLSNAYPDKKIMMTRTGDTYPTLDQRVVMANNFKLKPNETMLFISVHANASMNSKASGIEVWYLPPEYNRTLVDSKTTGGNKNLYSILNNITEDEVNRDSVLLARSVLDGMCAKVGKEIPSRGMKAESWYVVRKAKMPSILIEVGFVTNPSESLLLSTPSYLQKISEGIYNGVQDFVYDFEHSDTGE
ncbi:MAG: N-acetylmuramoyl-L-alanine amidase [Spirochaetia bacterium]|nr:N-acetylmuramoyl-L-alanine amidase [Spirochaetia bacterium]